MCICHSRAEWKGKGKQLLGLQLRIIHFSWPPLISTFCDTLSFWGRNHTHTVVLSVVYQSPNDYQGKWDRKWTLPTTSWCFRWFRGQTIVTALRRDCEEEKWKWKMADFPLKTSKSGHGGLVGSDSVKLQCLWNKSNLGPLWHDICFWKRAKLCHILALRRFEVFIESWLMPVTTGLKTK